MLPFDTFFGDVILKHRLEKLELRIQDLNEDVKEKKKTKHQHSMSFIGDSEPTEPDVERIVVNGFKIGQRRKNFETIPTISMALSHIKGLDQRIQDIAFTSKVHFLVLSIKINDRWQGVGYWDEEAISSGERDFSQEASENISLIVEKIFKILNDESALLEEQSAYSFIPSCSSSEPNFNLHLSETLQKSGRRNDCLKEKSQPKKHCFK